jgi:hypothetical protein
MYSVTVTYEQVKWPVTKKVTCAACGRGRKLTRSTTFTQTINPFNKVKEGPRAGQVKTRTEILRELQAEANAWQPTAKHPAGTCPTVSPEN